MDKKKIKIILADKGKKLFFEKNNMRFEIDRKIDLNNFVAFFAEVYAELVIAKYNIKSKRRRDTIRQNAYNLFNLN